MFQVDPWEKAADCERALRLTIDPVHRENLANIREFWISLANAQSFLSEGDFVKQAEAIGRFHAKPTWEFPRLCRGGSKSLTYPGVGGLGPSTRLQTASRQSTRKGVPPMDDDESLR